LAGCTIARELQRCERVRVSSGRSQNDAEQRTGESLNLLPDYLLTFVCERRDFQQEPT
jgi:hypothetical protein